MAFSLVVTHQCSESSGFWRDLDLGWWSAAGGMLLPSHGGLYLCPVSSAVLGEAWSSEQVACRLLCLEALQHLHGVHRGSVLRPWSVDICAALPTVPSGRTVLDPLCALLSNCHSCPVGPPFMFISPLAMFLPVPPWPPACPVGDGSPGLPASPLPEPASHPLLLGADTLGAGDAAQLPPGCEAPPAGITPSSS